MIKKIALFIFALSIFVTPGVIFANTSGGESSPSGLAVGSYSGYSEEQLVNLIAKLQKQLEELRKNQVACALADVDLSIGDGEGDTLKDSVKALQNFLKEKGYFTYSATGYFGKITRAALINFQRDMGLEQTGEINAAVREKIKTLKCKVNYYIKKVESKSENKSETVASGQVKSITLSGTGASVTWSTIGYSKNGFKIVWSKNSNPVYPNREGDKYIYLTDPAATVTTLEAFSGSGTYYVRVCEYLGGACGVYSNQIEVSL